MPSAQARKLEPNATVQRQRRKDARPQELLDAALTLFVDKGFAATRSEEVAQLAGVSKGTLYLYYPSKEELFKALVREHLSARISDGQALLDQHQGPMAELLSAMMIEWWQRIGQGPAGGLTRVMLAEARGLPELAAFYIDEVINPTHALLRGLLERGVASGEFRPVNVPAAVQVLIGPLLHLALAEHSFGPCAPEDEVPPQEVLATQLDLFLHGVLVRQ